MEAAREDLQPRLSVSALRSAIRAGEKSTPTASSPNSTESLLGLENTVLGERVTIVSDYLWTAYYINGWRKVHHASLREGVLRARKVVEDQELKDVVFLHYGGDNEDDECEFSKWNMIAHDLCQDPLRYVR